MQGWDSDPGEEKPASHSPASVHRRKGKGLSAWIQCGLEADKSLFDVLRSNTVSLPCGEELHLMITYRRRMYRSVETMAELVVEKARSQEL